MCSGWLAPTAWPATTSIAACGPHYFALAASGWLFSPLLLAVLALLILLVLYRRDYRSAVLDSLCH
jgi:uncharacterized membrane protein